MDLWVVIPAFDEEERIAGTLSALAAQTDTAFTVVVVDNGSRDGTAMVVKEFATTAALAVTMIAEHERGTGSAVDTGFRHAIAHGATHLARTDADCLPRSDWVAQVRLGFDGGAQMVCGTLVARRDEHTVVGRAGFRFVVLVASVFGRCRPANRGPRFRVAYRMHAGNNMAITPETYTRCGGMPRRASPTDREFLNRVRAVTPHIVRRRAMVVENSTRRLRAYGLRASARWYLSGTARGRDRDPR